MGKIARRPLRATRPTTKKPLNALNHQASGLVQIAAIQNRADQVSAASCCPCHQRPNWYNAQSTRKMKSASLEETTLWAICRQYNANNEQVYTDGDLNFETIFRFKGQQAPCVVLVDLDDTTKQDDWHTGILYCAMTDRKSTRLNSSHSQQSRMPSSA